MDRYTPTAPGTKAPSAPRPGTGSGNVPFAPGVISGNYGQGQPAPLARQMPQGPPPQQGEPSGPGIPQQGGPPGMGGPPMGGMPQMPMVTPWPQIYVTLLDAWMKGIMDSTSKPLIGGMY